MLEVVPNRIHAIRRAFLDWLHDDVGIKAGEDLRAAAARDLVFKGPPYDLHVLLRHRPRSISRAPGKNSK
jgi:hypothetical protein